MAKKLLNPLEDPPTASSSDDDEVENSSGEDEEQISDASSEEDQPKDPTKTLKTPAAAPAKPDSDSGSETGSDSESDPAEKTIAVTAAKPKKKEGNDSTVAKSGKKRKSEATTSKAMHVKKAKMVSGVDEKKRGEGNKKPFHRLWTEEDEISLLQGMIDFKAETGTSPYDAMNGFYDVAKKDISFDVSKVQFVDKIRFLKKKYFGKQKKKSLESTHDKKCLGLAKCVWGSDGMALESAAKSPVKSKKVEKKKATKEVLGSDVKSNGKLKKVESLKPNGDKVEEDKEVVILGEDLESPNWFEKSFLVRFIASLGVDEYSVKKKWSKVPVETKKRIQEKLKLVEAKEYELLLQKTDIVKEVASVITQAI